MAKPESDENENSAATPVEALDISVKDAEETNEARGAATQDDMEDAVVVTEGAQADPESDRESDEAMKPAQEAAQAAAEPVEPEEKPAPKAASARPAPPPPRRGLSVVIGGVLAAAIGSGATLYVLPQLPPELRAKVLPALSGTASDDAVAQQADRLAALEQAIGALQEATAPDVAGLQAALEELRAKVETGAAAPAEAGPELAKLQEEVTGLKALLENSPALATQEQLAAATVEAKARIAEAEAEAAKMRAESEAAAQRAMKQAAIARLAAAFEAGAPLATPLAEAEAAGIAIPDPLRASPPTVIALQSAFGEAARDALTLARKESAGETLQDKLATFLLAQTGARSLAAREGDSPDAVLSRAQSAVDEGRFDAALTELAALPEAAQAVMKNWMEMVGQRMAAQTALFEMAQSAQ